MVCDKVVCEGWCGERWCETKRCMKDGVWKWCVKMVCDGLWRCVKDGVWQSGVPGVKDGVSKMVCQRWCVKDGVWQSRVWQRWYVTKQRWMSPSAMPATQNEGGCHQVPRLPRKRTVDVSLCHACHVKRPRRHGRLNQGQARQPVPSVPRLPRKTTVVSLCHAYHAKRR